MKESCSVEILSDLARVVTIQDTWERLAHLTPAFSPFETLPWFATCWSSLAGRGETLHVAAAKDGGEIVAIFPMLVQKGCLRFVGGLSGNYAGPVYDPSRLDIALHAWRDRLGQDRELNGADLTGLRSESPFFQKVRRLSFIRWGRPSVVRLHKCPRIDLSSGWPLIAARHKSRERNTWARKWRKLSTLGTVAFEETGDPDCILNAQPRMFELFADRWRGQRLAGGLIPERSEFERRACVAMAHAGNALLSTLKMDEEIIAYSYGLRARGITSSYVLSHDARFEVYSPGLLLLLRVLESAAARRDPYYDFSFEEHPYKRQWSTGSEEVYRVLWGRGSRLRAAFSSVWVRARSVPRLGRLKREGLRGLFAPARKLWALPDDQGVRARWVRTWHAYLLPGSSTEEDLRELRPLALRRDLSPRLMGLALTRHFRGDKLLGIRDPDLAIVWHANPNRAEPIRRAFSWRGSIYYHPCARNERGLRRIVDLVSAKGGGLLITPEVLKISGLKRLGTLKGEMAVQWLA